MSGSSSLDPREVAVEDLPNAAGGYTVRVRHLPTRYFTTESGPDREVARAKALEALARMVEKRRNGEI